MVLVSLNREQCKKIGNFLKQKNFHYYDFGGKRGDKEHPSILKYGAEMVSNYYGSVIALDYGFYRIINGKIVPDYGVLDGQLFKGSSFLWRSMKKAFEENPSNFSLQSLAKVTKSQVKKIFTDDEGKLFVRDLNRRVKLWRDFGKKMSKYESINQVYELSEHKLLMPNGDGFLQRFEQTEAYHDPDFFKKANLLAKFGERRGIWKFEDPENKLPPLDYHLQNVAIKTGMINIDSLSLENKLRNKVEISLEEERVIRIVCKEAYGIISRESGIEPYKLDDLFWMSGRKYCQMEPPNCLGINEGEACLFSPVCLANTEKPKLKELNQPVLLSIVRY